MTSVSSFLSNAKLAELTPEMQTGTLPSQGVNLTQPQAGASIDRFESALQNAQAPSASSPAVQPSAPPAAAPTGANSPFEIQPDWRSLQQAQSTSGTSKTYGQMDAEARAVEKERALRGLELDRPVQATNAENAVQDSRGDMILDGLSRLRNTFDEQTANINGITSQPMGTTEKLIATQVEIVKYSLLMDVTSKLTGKSTQTFDTLMKGQ